MNNESPRDPERLVGRSPIAVTAPATDLHPAWNAEIERRLAEYDRGEMNAVDAEKVFARAKSLAR